MKRLLMTGAVALLGIVVPAGALVGATSTSAAAAKPRPALIHYGTLPILGKHVISHGRSISNATSGNWSGYADTSDTFKSVSGSWVEPAVTCPSGGLFGLFGQVSDAAFWVGLDGYSSMSVEQTGTDSDCSASGQASYYAWYEMYPASSIDLSTSSYPVSPNDVLNGSVTYNANGTFTLFLSDTTAGWKFSVTEAGSGSYARSSAEWVAEAPTSCSFIFCTEVNLAPFGSVAFSNASATDSAGHTGSISRFTDAAIQMVSDSTPKATPGSLTNGGTGFSIAWQHS